MVRADGSRAEHGNRRHYCPTSDTYRRHCARIADVLSLELSRHENVVAWQIDNELGPEKGWCYCGNCQARFQAWLRERYGTVEELNRRWQMGFWSMDFSDWRQVRLGENAQDFYSSRNLDSKRFRSDVMVDFAMHQARIIRRNHPGAIVTTNGMGPLWPATDYYRLFGELDVACDDMYFDVGSMDVNVAAMNEFRSIKPGRKYWVTETGSGALDHGKAPHRDQFRAWAWSSLAHGGEAHFVFRWRTCLSGQEQELQGMLDHSGRPGPRYQAVRDCFREMATMRERLGDLPLPEAPVAIVQDHDVMWGYESSRVGPDVDYSRHILRLHRELYDRNIVADIIPPARDLSGYKLVVLPTLVMIDEDFASRLADFVAKGGVCLATGQIGMRDHNDNYLAEPGPQHLSALLGVRIEGGMYLHSHVGPDEGLWLHSPKRGQVEVSLSGELAGEAVEGRAGTWIADITLDGGETLAKFTSDAYEGQPAVVEVRRGEGRAVYVGSTRLDDATRSRLVDYVLSAAAVERGPETPRHVEVVERGDVIFAVNHTDRPAAVEIGEPGEVLLGDVEGGTAMLGPYAVAVVRRR